MINNDTLARGWSVLGGKKYWIICQNGMQKIMVYRLNFFAWFVVEGLSFLVMAYLWLSIYKQGNQIGTYSLVGLLSYFAITRVIGMAVMTGDMVRQINDDISQGRLINFLLKPVSYCGKMFSQNLGEIFVASIYTLPVALPLIYFFRDELAFTLPRIGLFIISIAIAASVDFFFYYLLGMLTFFMENIFGVIFFAWMAANIFSGRTVPIDLLPAYLHYISN